MNKYLASRMPLLTRRQTLLALLGSAVLPGCGGGTDVAGVSSGGTGSFTNGVIVGLGSIIVNGIRYDDSAAAVSNDSGSSANTSLKLGMVVTIKGSVITPASVQGGLATATASSIAYDSEWKGCIDAGSPNGNGRGFTMMGQTVNMLDSTVYEGTTQDQVATCRYVEVYGFLDLKGSLQATRVEALSSKPDRYRLSGLISELTATTFKLGTAVILYSNADERPSTLKEGQLVRVSLKTTQTTGGQWIATRVRVLDAASELSDDDKVELEGSVTAFTAGDTSFSVNGVPVNASLIGVPPGLKLGVRVEVKGLVVNGLVVASDIELEDEQTLRNQTYEFHGTISGLDTGNKTFVIRGYNVKYVESPSPKQTTFDLKGKTLTEIQDRAVKLEVKAQLDPSGQLVATKIEVDD